MLLLQTQLVILTCRLICMSAGGDNGGGVKESLKGLTGNSGGKGIVDSVKDLASGSGGEGQSIKDLTGAVWPGKQGLTAAASLLLLQSPRARPSSIS